jgi:hypothetical protein
MLYLFFFIYLFIIVDIYRSLCYAVKSFLHCFFIIVEFIVHRAIKSAMASLIDEYLFVAAIDFGTTYSGYAFLSRDDFEKDPLKIVVNQAWNAGSQRHFSLKTPTCLLLDDKEELVSFGYEAENKYSDFVIDRKQNEYFFFQRFKM